MNFLEKLWRCWKKYSVNLSRWVTVSYTHLTLPTKA